MWAMIVKEFRQLRRDRRTLAMMIVLPVLLLVVFGYAASFDVKTIPTVVAGPQAHRYRCRPVPRGGPGAGRGCGLGADATAGQPGWRGAGCGDRGPDRGPGGRQPAVQCAGRADRAGPRSRQLPAGQAPVVRILFNPQLKTSYIMIPGLAGVVLAFIGIIITSLGVVRERQTGTLEQLAVMPLHPRDVFLGKIVPYFVVAAVDLAIVLAVGVALFGVPFRGSYAVFGLGALLFLFVTLGLGVLISSVSENQGQAIQLSFMFTLPQVLLSGLIFPLTSIAAGVRWISYILPLTYFNEISRGVMLRAEPIGALWQPLTFLALLGLIVMSLAMLRFRSYLSPAGTGGHRGGVGAGPRWPPQAPIRTRRRPGERGPAGSDPGWWGTERVSVRYGHRRALDQVTFWVAPGQVSAVVGGTPWVQHLAALPGRGAGAQLRHGPPAAAAADRLPARGFRHLPGPDRGGEPVSSGRRPTGSRPRWPASAPLSIWSGRACPRLPSGRRASCPAGCGRSWA